MHFANLNLQALARHDLHPVPAGRYDNLFKPGTPANLAGIALGAGRRQLDAIARYGKQLDGVVPGMGVASEAAEFALDHGPAPRP